MYKTEYFPPVWVRYLSDWVTIGVNGMSLQYFLPVITRIRAFDDPIFPVTVIFQGRRSRAAAIQHAGGAAEITLELRVRYFAIRREISKQIAHEWKLTHGANFSLGCYTTHLKELLVNS